MSLEWKIVFEVGTCGVYNHVAETMALLEWSQRAQWYNEQEWWNFATLEITYPYSKEFGLRLAHLNIGIIYL